MGRLKQENQSFSPSLDPRVRYRLLRPSLGPARVHTAFCRVGRGFEGVGIARPSNSVLLLLRALMSLNEAAYGTTYRSNYRCPTVVSCDATAVPQPYGSKRNKRLDLAQFIQPSPSERAKGGAQRMCPEYSMYRHVYRHIESITTHTRAMLDNVRGPDFVPSCTNKRATLRT